MLDLLDLAEPERDHLVDGARGDGVGGVGAGAQRGFDEPVRLRRQRGEIDEFGHGATIPRTWIRIYGVRAAPTRPGNAAVDRFARRMWHERGGVHGASTHPHSERSRQAGANPFGRRGNVYPVG
ncbi:hypothetical protein GCM10007904_43700 [Oharaeibacter diazotrophicus]|nr:hypothetical protein GCM10007904_43700 [Oharaeibacter diazotrophicus]